MAKRKGWDSLSDGYRERFEKKGLTREDYESGRPIKAARGHEHTPERPTSYKASEFPKYAAERERLTNELQRKKEEYFGGSKRWNRAISDRHIREKPPSMSKLRWSLEVTLDEWLDAIREDYEAYHYLGYG